MIVTMSICFVLVLVLEVAADRIKGTLAFVLNLLVYSLVFGWFINLLAVGMPI